MQFVKIRSSCSVYVHITERLYIAYACIGVWFFEDVCQGRESTVRKCSNFNRDVFEYDTNGMEERHLFRIECQTLKLKQEIIWKI